MHCVYRFKEGSISHEITTFTIRREVKLLESLGRITRREKTRELVAIVMKFAERTILIFKGDRAYDS